MFITFSDLAQLKGVSRSAVSQRRQTGILDAAIVKVGAREKLNKELALELWDKNSVSFTPEIKESKKNVVTNEDVPSFNESRAKREAMMARLAEIDVEEREKLLVPSEEVKNAWIQLVTIAKTKVLGIPTKAKQRIPDLDKGAMTLLDEIVRETLEDLAVENVEAA